MIRMHRHPKGRGGRLETSTTGDIGAPVSRSGKLSQNGSSAVTRVRWRPGIGNRHGTSPAKGAPVQKVGRAESKGVIRVRRRPKWGKWVQCCDKGAPAHKVGETGPPL
ncbi:hypothetical protein Y032_0003g1666 [Ancylostoma ceylanicum]|uniref:Uncharacterized protein n=1 Tax=Ancylostoma ceylanicum TaxID=53326 RepID=A0A016VYD8_9BILA|nr:hypothetical protein Y032_0003g1666 [Ancylostoma ceylanicum]